MDTVGEFALTFDWEKISCHTRESNPRQWHAGPMLYLISYIPSHPVFNTCVYVCRTEVMVTWVITLSADSGQTYANLSSGQRTFSTR